jgi:molybdopterin synthase catalytic subunit
VHMFPACSYVRTEKSGLCQEHRCSQIGFCNFVAAVMKFGLPVWKKSFWGQNIH